MTLISQRVAIYSPKSLWDLKNEMNSFHFNQFLFMYALVSGQYTQTSGFALDSRAYCPDTKAFPYTEIAHLSAEEIFCLLNCSAGTAKKYVLFVCDHGFFLVSLGYVPRGTLLSQVITNFIKTKHLKEGENKEQKERTHVQARKQKWSVNKVGK